MATVKDMAEGFAELVAQGYGEVPVMHLQVSSGCTDDDLGVGLLVKVGEATEFMEGPICDLEPGTVVCLTVT